MKKNEKMRFQLAEWLAEWELEQVLEPDPQQEPSEPHPTVDAPAPARGTDDLYESDPPCTGDVRLLKPRRTGGLQTERPLYAVVIENLREDGWVWIPFSRFSVPALPDEWKTGLRQNALRVLSLWNAQPVEQGGGPPSWRVRRLPDRPLTACCELYRARQAGEPLTSAQQKRVGPPLLHPGDPRHDYMEIERERFAAYFHVPEARTIGFVDDSAHYLSEPVVDGSRWLMAAEQRERYGLPGAIYRTADAKVAVAVYLQDGQSVRIRLIDHDGSPCLRYDGGHVEAVSGERSGLIDQGVALAPAEAGAQCAALINANGVREGLYR